MSERIIIKTARKGVVLKQLVPEDAAHYFALVDADRGHLSQNGDTTAQKYPTLESVQASITGSAKPRGKLRFGLWDGDTFVGTANLTPLRDGRCETGGWTGKQFCGRGYAPVTRYALATYAIRVLGYRRVIATTHPDNAASQRALAKASYRLVRRCRNKHYFSFAGLD